MDVSIEINFADSLKELRLYLLENPQHNFLVPLVVVWLLILITVSIGFKYYMNFKTTNIRKRILEKEFDHKLDSKPKQIKQAKRNNNK